MKLLQQAFTGCTLLALVGCTINVNVPQQPPKEERAVMSQETAPPNSSSVTVIPEMYSAEIIQVGGEGSHTVTKSVWSDNVYFDANEFISLDFNRGGDLMWVRCRRGYVLTRCEGDVVIDETFGCGLIIKDQLQNIVSIECNME